MEYWEECVSEALEDAGLSATRKQIEAIAGWVEGAHDNYGMATGSDVATTNYHASYESKIAEANARTNDEVEAVSRKLEQRIKEIANNYERRIYSLVSEIERLRNGGGE